MAMSGLLLSSVCLVVVQGILAGLQGNRIERSKEIEGNYYLKIKKYDEEKFNSLRSFLVEKNVSHIPEYVIEGLLKNANYVAPVVLHGSDFSNHQLEFVESNSKIGSIFFSVYIAQKTKAKISDELQFLSPAHTDSFFGDLPRYKTLTLSKLIDSRDPEIDEFHAWTDLRSVQSLIRKKELNGIAVYNQLEASLIKTLEDKFGQFIEISAWEKKHANLVYALSLENNIILFLFSATVVLVGLCIISGLSIFFNRLRQDFVSFWILGMSVQKIRKVGVWNISLITVLTLLVGNILGVVLCLVLKDLSPSIMPEMFVERSLPIKLKSTAFLFSFVLPFLLSIFFTIFSGFKFISSKTDFLNSIRSVGK